MFGLGAARRVLLHGGWRGSTPLRVSLELVQDAEFDIEGLVSRKLGERITGSSATPDLGTGVKQPLGIVTGLTPIAATGTDAIVYDDLITWIHSVDPAYRRPRWAFNDQSLAVLEKIKDATATRFWRPPRQANIAINTAGRQYGTLLGYPVTIDQAFPDFDITSGTTSRGRVRQPVRGLRPPDREGRRVLVNPYSRMANRQIEYSAWAREDATQQNTNAYVVLGGVA